MNGRHYALTSVAPPCGPQRRPRAASRRPPMRQRRRHTATSAAAEVTTGTSHWPIRFVVARRSFVFCFLVFVFLFFVFFSVRFDCRLDGPLHSKTYLIGSLSLIFFIELASFKHIILLIRIHSNKNTEQYCWLQTLFHLILRNYSIIHFQMVIFKADSIRFDSIRILWKGLKRSCFSMGSPWQQRRQIIKSKRRSHKVDSISMKAADCVAILERGIQSITESILGTDAVIRSRIFSFFLSSILFHCKSDSNANRRHPLPSLWEIQKDKKKQMPNAKSSSEWPD